MIREIIDEMSNKIKSVIIGKEDNLQQLNNVIFEDILENIPSSINSLSINGK